MYLIKSLTFICNILRSRSSSRSGSAVIVYLKARIIGYNLTTISDVDFIFDRDIHLIESRIFICTMLRSRSSFEVKGQIYKILKLPIFLKL